MNNNNAPSTHISEGKKVVLAVPPGLELACSDMAKRELGVSASPLSRGLIELTEIDSDSFYNIINDAPRWTYGAFITVFTLSTTNEASQTNIHDIENAIQNAASILGVSGGNYWLWADKNIPTAVYKIKQEVLKSTNLGVHNNPTDYVMTIRFHCDRDQLLVLAGMSISVKRRFDYRKKDVGASINPVLAACIVRLIPKNLTGASIDPTCGSGTLLIERLRYSNECKGIGIDISNTAGCAFLENASELPNREVFSFIHGDSTDEKYWEKCSSVICNLPFGIRLKDTPENLKSLYTKILANAVRHIDEKGRIILISSFKTGIEYAVSKIRPVKVLATYKSEMGGLFYQIFVLRKGGK